MSALWPRQCIRIHGTPAAATTAAISGSARPPETSLTIRAPAASAAAATSARVVSTLQMTPARASSVITGTTRPASVAADTRCAPGLVDSPPTSMMSAPSAASCDAAGDGRGRIEIPATVGERVGGDVQHAHHHGAVGGRCQAMSPVTGP